MKTLILSLIAVVAVNANARSIQFPFEHLKIAEIQKIERIQGDNLPGTSSGGNISINLTKRTVQLMTYIQPECNPFHFCPAVIYAHTVELPLVKTIKGACGTTYIAREDKRPVDGLLQELTVVDYSSSTCHFVTPDFSAAIYRTVNGGRGGKVETLTNIEAGKFEEMMPY